VDAVPASAPQLDSPVNPDFVRAKVLPLTRTTAIVRGDGGGLLVDSLLAELIDRIANVLATDPGRVARLAALFVAPRANESLPLLMSKADYAKRLTYSVRKLDQLIAAGLPTRGRGRALRIPVFEADQWVNIHLTSLTDEEAEIDVEAMAAVRRRAERGPK